MGDDGNGLAHVRGGGAAVGDDASAMAELLVRTQTLSMQTPWLAMAWRSKPRHMARPRSMPIAPAEDNKARANDDGT